MWLTLASTLGAILGGIGIALAYTRAQTPKVWQETAAGYRERAELLSQENVALRERVSTLEGSVSELSKRPDLTALMTATNELAVEQAATNAAISKAASDLATKATAEIASMVARHEEVGAARDAHMLTCLQEIASSLKEVNGH